MHWNSGCCKEATDEDGYIICMGRHVCIANVETYMYRQGQTGIDRDRQGQTETDRDRQGQAGTIRDHQGQMVTSRDMKGLSLFVFVCPCLVPACPCLSLLCPCLSLLVPMLSLALPCIIGKKPKKKKKMHYSHGTPEFTDCGILVQ